MRFVPGDLYYNVEFKHKMIPKNKGLYQHSTDTLKHGEDSDFTRVISQEIKVRRLTFSN